MPYTLLPRLDTLGFATENYVDQGLRLVTAGLFGQSNVESELLYPFVYEQPYSPADRQNGGICAVTGYWAPAHCLVQTKQGRAIKEFAGYDHILKD